MKILFLTSGGGGNLRFFYTLKKLGYLKENVELLALSYKNCNAIKYANQRNLKSLIIDYSMKNNKELIHSIKSISPDFIITTWNRIIDSETLNTFPDKFYNLHYSLLPAFKGSIGIKPIELAYDVNCLYIGSTVHKVTEEVDGGRIIGQFVMKKGQDIQKDADVIFKNSCILLLNSLNILSNFTILNLPSTQIDLFQFSPELTFDANLINKNSFWEVFKTEAFEN
jgi:phosphoribosylglycinamide formyltransferase-1